MKKNLWRRRKKHTAHTYYNSSIKNYSYTNYTYVTESESESELESAVRAG